MTISPYLNEHRPEQQTLTEGIPINPNLRPDFDHTDNDERDPLETSDQWGRPFIRTENWEDNAESWEAHVERLKQSTGMNIPEKQAYEMQQAASKQSWLETFPSGIRYQVRCLGGGAWDRSTNWGMVDSLEEALQIIKQLSE